MLKRQPHTTDVSQPMHLYSTPANLTTWSTFVAVPAKRMSSRLLVTSRLSTGHWNSCSLRFFFAFGCFLFVRLFRYYVWCNTNNRQSLCPHARSRTTNRSYLGCPVGRFLGYARGCIDVRPQVAHACTRHHTLCLSFFCSVVTKPITAARRTRHFALVCRLHSHGERRRERKQQREASACSQERLDQAPSVCRYVRVPCGT